MFINFCFQISCTTAIDCSQTKQQIQSLHMLHVTQQYLHTNCLQMIKKEQWPTSSPDLNPLEIPQPMSNARSFLKA